MLYRILFSFLLVLSGFFARSQQTREEFVQKTDYLLYLPEGYTKDTIAKWPLVLFLHGSGESGYDLEKVKTHGPPKLVGQGKKFPFILVSPQAPSPSVGWEPNTLYQLLQDVKAKYRVDADRIYLTGLSMGGFGSWSLAMKHPEEFAAVVPICGGGDTADIWQLRNTPVWCFHGALDNVVPLASSQKMVDGLKRYNPSVRFTIYPDANHNSWTVTYDNDSLYRWMLAQKKFEYKRVAADPALLKKYTGRYASSEHDTVQVLFERDSLKAKTDRFTIELKPEAKDRFFVAEKHPEDLQFFWNAKGVVEGFVLYGGKRVWFRRYE